MQFTYENISFQKASFEVHSVGEICLPDNIGPSHDSGTVLYSPLLSHPHVLFGKGVPFSTAALL